MRTTRMLAAVAAASVIVSAAGCSTTGSSSPSASSANAKITVAFVLPTATQPYWLAMKLAAEKEAEKLGINLLMQAPQTVNVGDQNSVLNLMMSQNPDALIATPLDPNLSAPPLQAAAQKIPVITVDIQVADPSFLTQEVIANNEAGGVDAAKALAEAMGDSGKVLLLPANATSSTAKLRADGFTKELANHSGLSVVATQYSNEDPSGTQSKINNVLLAHPDLGGIFATEDHGCVGAIAALKAKGLAGKVKLTCYDANKDQVDAIKTGEVTALIAQRPDREIQIALQTAVDAVAKKAGIEKRVEVENTVMTKDNLAETEGLTYPSE